MTNRFSVIKRGLPLQLLVSLISFLILYSRRPDAVVNPQFWAEDISWYEDAYALNLFQTVSRPVMGYLQTISRLTAGFAQLFPLAYAPLIYNAVGFIIKISIVNFLISKRFSKVVPNLTVCFALGLVSLAVPHSAETHINLTNAHWHLSVLSFLVIISYADDKIGWKIFDIVVVSVSAVSGPFAPFLLPIAVIIFWKRKEKWTVVLIVILTIGSLIQIYCLTQSRHPAEISPTANSWNLIDLICGQVFFSAIFGSTGFFKLWETGWKYPVLILTGILSFTLVIYSFIKLKLELNLFILYAAMILTSAIIFADWIPNIYPLYGERYWVIPITCYLCVIVCCAAESKNLFIKSLSIFLLLLSSIGICGDWLYPPYTDYHFEKFAQEYEEAPAGTELKTKVNPGWILILKKK